MRCNGMDRAVVGSYKQQYFSVMFVGIGSAISIAIFESVRGSARS